MNKVNISFAIVFILSVLTVRLWASHKSGEIMGPLMLRTGPDSTIYVPCDDQLYLYGRDGGLVDVLSLERFGIDRYIDDFWVYDNKDLLLRKELFKKPFLSRVVESFQHPGSRMIDRMVANQSTMQRCSTVDYKCKRLEQSGDTIDTLGFFRLFADERKDSLFVSDNLGHQLLLLDTQGKLLKKSERQFEFPNQVVLGDDGLLYVAENRRIVGVSTDSRSFGKIEREFKVSGKFGKIYVTALAQSPSGDWWIIASGMSMQGGDLLIYTKEGSYKKTIDLPGGADPFSLVALQDRVLVSDPTLMRIYSISYDGSLQEDFGSDSLFYHLATLKNRKKVYSSMSSVALWVLIAAVTFTFIIYRNSLGKRTEITAHGSLDISLTEPMTRKYDYAQVLSIFKAIAMVQVVLLALAIILSYLLMPSRQHEALKPVLLMIAILMPVALYMIYYQLKNTVIEITEKGITYTAWRKRVYSPWQDVKEIRSFGRQSRIYTQHGTIPVGIVSPAGMVVKRSFLSFEKDRSKYLDELLSEVRRRAPNIARNS